MEGVFLFCFYFGLLFTVVSAAMGAIGGHMDAGGGGHLDTGGGHVETGGHDLASMDQAHGIGGVKWLSSHGHDGFNVWSYVSISSVMAFLCWFGAAGYVAMHSYLLPLALSLGLALATGLTGGGIVSWFLAKLRSGDTQMRPEDYRLEGTLADVTVSIPEGGVGEIVFSLMGVRRSEGARGVTGAAFPRGSKVVITGYERGVAKVEAFQALLDDHGTKTHEPEIQRPRPLADPEQHST